MASAKIIGFRADPTLHGSIMQAAEIAGVTMSEWVRLASLRALDSETSLVDLGYLQARRMGLFLASQIIGRAAQETLPETYEEYLAAGNPPFELNT